MVALGMYQQRLGLRDNSGAVVAPETLRLGDDGVVPNSVLPVLLYRGDADANAAAASDFEAVFEANQWPPQWRGGVFGFHHYHATAHEVLGVYAGWAQVQLGGEHGPVITLHAGDIVILPAGAGHCRIDASARFGVVGAYPANQPDWDLCRADPGLHDAALARIAQVPLPPSDPLAGAKGSLIEHWYRG